MMPHTLKIGGHVYKIRCVGRKGLPKDSCGVADSEANVLKMYRGLAPSRKVETVIHEALHAMLTGHEYKDEENIIVALGERLTEFIKANPSFIRHALATLCQ